MASFPGLRGAAPVTSAPRSWRRVNLHRNHHYVRPAVQTLEQPSVAPVETQAQLKAADPDEEMLVAALYDPDREHKYFKQNRVLVAQRMAMVTYRAMQFASAVFVDKVESAVTRSGSSQHRPAKTLQEAVTKLGPCFIKLAQTLSMRPDLVGETYAESLSELQDSVAPFSTVEAFAILEQELGRPVKEVFSWISQEPVASASLGQVYRAVLASTGQEVAVKVQRPGVEPTVALDVYLLRRMIGVVQKAAGISRDLRVVADEIGRSLFGEMDFRLEAQHGEEFLRAHRDLHFVRVPEVVRELTTRRVLVMEWVDGQSPSQLLSKSAAGDRRSAAARARILSLVSMGIQCSLSQLLVTGVMHGDPHSGNLLLTPDGRLCYLDFGMLVRVPDQHRQAMMCALIHMGLGEWRRLVDDLANLDLLKPGTDRKALAQDLEREFMAVLTQQAVEEGGGAAAGAGGLGSQLPLLSLQTAALSFGTLTAVLFRVAFKYKFLLPPYFPLVVRSVVSLEGVALLVDPSFKLISAGMPIVLHQLLSDRRPAALSLLRELLLGPGGALRTDATAQQIMQVWARAREQEVSSTGGPADAPPASPVQLGGLSMTGPSLDLGGSSRRSSSSLSSGGSLSSEDLWEGEEPSGGIDLAGLLLGRDNAPLRRVLMEVNPAATVAAMQPDMRATVRGLAVDVLGPLPLGQLLGRQSATGSSAAGKAQAAAERAQRKRLAMLARAQAARVAKSPPAAVLQLVLFTAQIVAAVAAVKLRQAWVRMLQRVQQTLVGLRQQRPRGGASRPPPSTAFA
ncbi:hypothetical protein N2152v2_002452 [Parachlorella kessleri]